MDGWRRNVLKVLCWTPVVVGCGMVLRRTKSQAAERPLLRPPGAHGEAEFLAACIRCNQCVAACPQECLLPAGIEHGLLALGTPHINARLVPCDLCQGEDRLQCIAACPTPALLPTERRDVTMGLAVIDPDTCLPFLGVACKACWHACPFPNEAIRFDQRGRPIVLADGCVGCGLCEHACLAQPAAIVIECH